MVEAMSSVQSYNFILSLDNSTFCVYLICGCLLVLKMMGVTLLTIYYRFKHKAFICEEDAKWQGGQIILNDRVERIRRAFQNDLENIPNFLAIGFAYLWIQPYVWLASILYIAFTVLRVLHTVVYVLIILPQPTRAMLWLGGFLITGYMAIHTAVHAFIHLVS